jgi:hypothetical protein
MQKPPESPAARMKPVFVSRSSDEDGADEQDLGGKGDKRGCRTFDDTHDISSKTEAIRFRRRR